MASQLGEGDEEGPALWRRSSERVMAATMVKTKATGFSNNIVTAERNLLKIAMHRLRPERFELPTF